MKLSSRLSHTTNAAYLRKMQMSTAQLFVFVEGPSDRNFYNSIIDLLVTNAGIKCNLIVAKELPSKTGGKPGLLDFFEFLKQNSALIDDFKGKKTASMFYLDKDVDDYLGQQKQSDHVVYTQYYCWENYLYVHGDLIKAVAAAASLDNPSIRARLATNNQIWRRQVAENCKEWVKFCFFTQKRGLKCICNYGVRSSQINNGPYASVDATKRAVHLTVLQRASGLTTIGFKRVFGQISREIDELYNDENYDLVFKGSWYVSFLAQDVEMIASGRTYNKNGLPDRLISCLQLTLDFTGSWTTHFAQPLEDLLTLLK